MKAAGVFGVDAVTAFVAQVESLSRKIDGMMTLRAVTIMVFETCSGGHATNDCLIVSTSSGQHEQVDFVSGMNWPQWNP